MFEKYIRQEIRSLESITQKVDLLDFYHRSRRCLSCNNQRLDNDLLLCLVRDYALFDEDNLYVLQGDDFRG